MGEIANCILVRNGRLRNFDARGAALVDTEIVRGPLSVEEGYMDEAEADDLGDLIISCAWGGMILDWDTRPFYFFGGEDIKLSVPQRRFLMDFMRATAWKGWTVGYMPREIIEIADRAGFPRPDLGWLDPNRHILSESVVR